LRRGWPSRSCCSRAATGSRTATRSAIGLHLAQEDLAQLLGASRQRVNQELKGFERDGAVRIEPTRLVVLSKDKLLAIASRQ
jgi:Mn-dependent DtxR family transcriptional regulator